MTPIFLWKCPKLKFFRPKNPTKISENSKKTSKIRDPKIQIFENFFQNFQNFFSDFSGFSDFWRFSGIFRKSLKNLENPGIFSKTLKNLEVYGPSFWGSDVFDKSGISKILRDLLKTSGDFRIFRIQDLIIRPSIPYRTTFAIFNKSRPERV